MTVYRELPPESAQFLGSAFAQPVLVLGTNAPVTGIAYDAAADESAFWKIIAVPYGSGNLTLELQWYADTASSGVVRWGAAIAAITPDTDSQDIETKSFATEQTVDDTHLGTTGQRVHTCSITVSNLDSLANKDLLFVRIRRIGSNAADTMTGDAILTQALLSYSET